MTSNEDAEIRKHGYKPLKRRSPTPLYYPLPTASDEELDGWVQGASVPRVGGEGSANILVHRLGDIMAHTYYTEHVTWVQTGDGRWNGTNSLMRPVATRVRRRGQTGGPEGLLAGLTTGSAHCTGKPRGSGWDSGRTKLPNPRAPPMPSDAD